MSAFICYSRSLVGEFLRAQVACGHKLEAIWSGLGVGALAR